jgi:hypothetical protein
MVLLTVFLFLSVIFLERPSGANLLSLGANDIDATISDLWIVRSNNDSNSHIEVDIYFSEVFFLVEGNKIYRQAQVSKRFYDTSLVGQIVSIQYMDNLSGQIVIDSRFQNKSLGILLFFMLLFVFLILLCVQAYVKKCAAPRRVLLRSHWHQICVKFFLSIGVVSLLVVSPPLSYSVEASIWMLIGWPSFLAAAISWILPVALTMLAKHIFEDLFVASDNVVLFRRNTVENSSFFGQLLCVFRPAPRSYRGAVKFGYKQKSPELP